jgi:hypothetical protein
MPAGIWIEMRSGTIWLALAVALLAGAGAASLLVSFQPDLDAAPAARAPASASPAPAPATPVRAQIATVDSAEAAYPVSDWQRGRGGFGWIDGVALSGGQALPERPLTDADTLELGGWAGDVDLGLRARFVAIAVCGRVVATPNVELPRPDVADSVHPNLFASGWRAQVAVKHLPRCAEPRLEVWGPVGPFQFAIPLEGARALNLAPAGGESPVLRGPARLRTPPSEAPALRRAIVQGQGNVNLRRCAGTNCATAGQLAAGPHQAIMVDEAADWLLLAVPASGRTGWIARRLVRIE